MITVHGTYVRADGTPDSGIVILRPAVPGIVDSDIVTTHTVASELDDTGSFTLQVLDSSDFQTNGPMPYLITEQLAGFRRSWIAELHGPDVDLADLQPLAEAPPAGWVPPTSSLDDLADVDVSLSATGMALIKQQDGTWKGANIRQNLNQLTDVTAPPTTPPNSLLGTVGDGLTPGVAEWEPLHLDYIQSVVLGPIPSSVADLSQRVTELEHTNEIVPPDLELTVDLYGGSFTRVIGCDPITAAPPKRITVALATTPGVSGAVFPTLGDISGTGAVWADFGGTLGKVVDTSGTGVNGAALKEAIRRGQIVTVHRGTDGTHPTLVVEKVENPADAGSSLTLDALRDVTAPASTPAGKVLGTTATGVWGPVDGVQGNLLTANQASVETDTTGFFPYNGPTLSSVAASSPSHGSKVLRAVCAAGVTEIYPQGGSGTNGLYWPCSPGQTFTFEFDVRQTVGTRAVVAVAAFWNSSFVAIGSPIQSTTQTPGDTFIRQTITVTAPAGAAYIYVKPKIAAGSAGDTLEFDRFGLWAGAGGTWAMPGVPITNLGRRVTHPNTDDVLVETWDEGKGRWQRQYYDSGWRLISSWDAAGVVTGAPFGAGWAPRAGAAGNCRLRRINDVVHVSIEQIEATANPSVVMFGAMPSGFGCAYNHRLATVPATVDVGILNTLGIGRLGGGSVAAGPIYNISGSAPCVAAIPTSLPGILVSAAPN